MRFQTRQEFVFFERPIYDSEIFRPFNQHLVSSICLWYIFAQSTLWLCLVIAPGVLERPASSSFGPRERLPERRGQLRQVRRTFDSHWLNLPSGLDGGQDRSLPNHDSRRGEARERGRVDASGLHPLQHVGI